MAAVGGGDPSVDMEVGADGHGAEAAVLAVPDLVVAISRERACP